MTGEELGQVEIYLHMLWLHHYLRSLISLSVQCPLLSSSPRSFQSFMVCSRASVLAQSLSEDRNRPSCQKGVPVSWGIRLAPGRENTWLPPDSCSNFDLPPHIPQGAKDLTSSVGSSVVCLEMAENEAPDALLTCDASCKFIRPSRLLYGLLS
ncbi:hypothetical protein J6590_087525 [Homalodisca vitripennis]|nr:hypothetical protein J6590_087525 [Homalodisca vitripennis]